MLRLKRSISGTWIVPLCLFLVVFTVYVRTAERGHVNDDVYAAAAGAWRIAATGTPYFDGVTLSRVGGAIVPARRGIYIGPAANGHITALRSMGPVLAGVPFYLLVNRDSEPQTFTPAAGAVGAALLTSVTVLFVFLTVRQRLRPIGSLAVTGVFAFATPTWVISADGIWTHTVTQLGIAGASYFAARSRWWWVGALFGVAILGRVHVSLIAAVVGIGVAVVRRDPRVALQVGIPSALAMAAVVAWNRVTFGALSLGGAYGHARITKAATGLGSYYSQADNYLGFLIAPDRGFLIWTPVALLLLPALVRARRELPDWTWFAATGGLVYTFFQLRINYFGGGDLFYGYRLGLELLTTLVPLLAFASIRIGSWARLLLPMVIAVQFAMISVGAVGQGPFVFQDDVWQDNSFFYALRLEPTVVRTWLYACLGVGAFASFVLGRSDGAQDVASHGVDTLGEQPRNS
jgi:alpha-1,2-mannosyltransferase